MKKLCIAVVIALTTVINTHPKKRIITLINDITDDMLAYSKYWQTFHPDFSLIVNDELLKQGSRMSTSIIDDTLNITYSYSFAGGYKKGTRTVTFNVPQEATLLHLSFSWDAPARIIADNAHPLSYSKNSSRKK